MSTRNNSARNKRGTPRRRKIALACETCREKKVRCDGEKPICGPCSRRSYPIDRCVYKIENARSASNDAYLKILHDRIRELEEACTQNGVSVPPAPQTVHEGENKTTDGTNEAESNASELDAESKTSVAAEGLLGLGTQPALRHSSTPIPTPAAPQPILSPINSQSTRTGPGQSNTLLQGSLQSRGPIQPPPIGACLYPSPLNSHGSVTAMGAISVADDGDCNDSPREQYYGNSSAASFMRLARNSIPIQSHGQNLKGIDREPSSLLDQNTGLWQDLNTTTTPPGFQFSDFSLPPRPLADHLLECYWERVHCLYPFFHRPSFEKAYENLWGSSRWPKPNLPQLNIGLGGSFDSGPQSIVFHCALNTIFALSCHFSDIPAGERETAAYTFFLRAKRFVGLDLLDRCTIGVVQTLLIVALLLQSTPYPNRCWNSIGLACRVAQGLGLYEAPTQKSISPLEKEVRCRTWHGCVMMDMIVSMTYGRPSMTSHILPVRPVPPPAMRPSSHCEDPCALSEQPCDHELGYLTFYVSTIELYEILESILADVYNAWQGRADHHRSISVTGVRQNSLDLMMELDDKLSAYEAQIPPMLNWTTAQPLGSVHSSPVLQRQRNVLRARCIHLRLLLYRPMFTQVCSEERIGLTEPRKSTSRPEKSVIYTSTSVNCAVACVKSAIELVSLVYETYQTSVTDAWWYNGFYTSTAGFVLIMSHSCSAILNQIDLRTVADTWRKCEKILIHMAPFSISARSSLQFLQVTHDHIVHNYNSSVSENSQPFTGQSHQRRAPRTEAAAQPSEASMHESEPSGFQKDVPGINPLVSWDEIGQGQDEFGFLGRFDMPDIASWFSDLPDPSSF
ncbi:uncharacterized protein N7483_004794 [Penicillium malachiteum]|uniref:uncharacterized protein n=1 Tax=Penicillium malachiteum TaxID=1324776 RepID=UPI002547CA8B|nr:uncharacterized protein N7483_004794 [Penicillium malachiteum]KAJ5730286.1 hypothetical protein N7483_004794 [Penicillium malachiteum]